MTGIALEAAGWRNSHGVWTPQPGFLSVTGDAAFLANPAAQEAALNRYMNDNERQLERAGVWARGERREIIQGFDGQPVPLTPAGLAAAAHREGAPRVIQYLEVRAANGALPASRPGQRGYRSSYNEIERRLRAFSGESYERMR
ncbi:hypothetical protein KPL78_01365 [Roseomonas sp. HJA6]|uniref:Uncharacterized protein n=1 Tax=Roseomonas alba TaxID=2846776 RepID=A0ABS7A569_9PROT|nr:hypothetical protein [Neoroseomonas alba]MBW6396470.1 hypothetical protein [Neoroseomonas alba]